MKYMFVLIAKECYCIDNVKKNVALTHSIKFKQDVIKSFHVSMMYNYILFQIMLSSYDYK